MAYISFNQTLSTQKPVPPAIKFFFGYIFPWPFILMGALTLFFSLHEWDMADMSTSWPTVPGVVQSSGISWSSDKHGSTATAKVVYTYHAYGHDHTCNRVCYGDYGSSDTSHADSIVSQYPVGQAVTVSFEPSDPSVAVLQPGVQGSIYFLPVFSLIFLVVGLAMLWFLPQAMASIPDAVSPSSDNLLTANPITGDPGANLPPSL